VSWDEVIGQERAMAVLRASVERRGGLTLMLFGPRGVGKGTAAMCAARILLCPDGEGVAKIDRGTHADFLRLAPAEGKRWITTDQTREAILWMQKIPLETEKRVLVIDPADALRIEAANALLKTLEEPPGHGVQILLTESLSGLPETVVSRCQSIRFRPLSEEALREILQREGADPDRIGPAVRLARGSARRALAFAGEGGEEAYRFVEASLDSLQETGVPEAARSLYDRVDGDREKVGEVIEMIAEICRDRLLSDLGADDLRALPGPEGPRRRPDADALLRVFPVLWQSREDIAAFVDPRLVLEKTLSDMHEELD
jgi:DNA polymerase-3 subunit delta'